MPDQTQIRRLEVADAPDYRSIRLRALRDNPEAFLSSFEEESLRPMADTEKRLASVFEKLWGAFVNRELVGMVGLSREARLKNRHKASLVSMFVLPTYTGKGLGADLVDTVIQDASSCGIELMVLTVTDTNLAAISLYQKAGFTAFGTEPDAIRINGAGFGKTHMYLSIK